VHAPPAPNSSPLDGYQHFGEVFIDGQTSELRVDLLDAAGTVLFSQLLPPPAR